MRRPERLIMGGGHKVGAVATSIFYKCRYEQAARYSEIGLRFVRVVSALGRLVSAQKGGET